MADHGAGDDELLTDMPYILLILTVLPRAQASCPGLPGQDAWTVTCDEKRAWRYAVPCDGLPCVLRTFHTSR